MKRFISFVLIVTCTLDLFSQNLVVNPGFDTWQKINKPTGWATALGCLKDSTQILSLIYSCRQSATTESRDLGQLIPVTEGNPYSFSVWYRNDTSGTGNGCRIWSNWKDAEGNALNDETSLSLLHSGYLKSDTWKQYSAEITSPPNAAYFNLIARTLPNSVTYWDDIIFEENVPTYRGEMSSDDIRVYPNPAANYITISDIQCIQCIDILSISGIKVWSLKSNGEESLLIPVAGFKDGIYIVRLYSSGKIKYLKFLKASSFAH